MKWLVLPMLGKGRAPNFILVLARPTRGPINSMPSKTHFSLEYPTSAVFPAWLPMPGIMLRAKNEMLALTQGPILMESPTTDQYVQEPPKVKAYRFKCLSLEWVIKAPRWGWHSWSYRSHPEKLVQMEFSADRVYVCCVTTESPMLNIYSQYFSMYVLNELQRRDEWRDNHQTKMVGAVVEVP